MNESQIVRKTVTSTLRRVLEDTGRTAKEFHDNYILSEEIGLDSLDLAQVVVILDQQFGVDPFRIPGITVRTLGDLVQVYYEALNETQLLRLPKDISTDRDD